MGVGYNFVESLAIATVGEIAYMYLFIIDLAMKLFFM